MIENRFKTPLAERTFRNKYAQGPNDSWDALAERLVEDVCGTQGSKQPILMSDGDRKQLAQYIKEMKFIPGGRYLYYAGTADSDLRAKSSAELEALLPVLSRLCMRLMKSDVTLCREGADVVQSMQALIGHTKTFLHSSQQRTGLRK